MEEKKNGKKNETLTRGEKIMAKDTKGCNNGTYIGKLYYETGELKYEGWIKDDTPHGLGVKYYKNGQKHMEGRFGDWFIESGKEYSENGNLKFEGEYNYGPRWYYGPRYFVEGKLYYETGELWYEGKFFITHSFSIGYPLFKGSDSFSEGIGYDKFGQVVKIYTISETEKSLKYIIP